MSETADIQGLPYAFAKRHGVLVLDSSGAEVSVGLREGSDPRALLEVRRALGREITMRFVPPREFESLLGEQYGARGLDADTVSGELAEAGDLGALADDLPAAADLLESNDDAPVIKLINGILAEAIRDGASDIHVEPFESALTVRLRVDGVLKEVLRLPPKVAPLVTSRIKVMARLDIAERRVPQDGRISLTLGGRELDVRVSTLPSRGGERVVMRILDKEQAELAPSDLGMPDAMLHVFREALSEPNGIVLVTGPTGSGKTTSLYAGLRMLNDGERNILTVEDPVEYSVEGIGQTQVNTKVGMSFAAGLRAILRQDPDVVMVGEIRDHETAEIAVQASLTGHLVLSTVHTNDAVGAITRLKDLGVEPFLMASSLRLVVAQRLVRQLCPSCAVPHQATAAEAAPLGLETGVTIHQAAGCGDCGNTGFRGRIGVFEMIRIDKDLRELMLSGADEGVIARHAFSSQPNMSASARRLVLEGRTTVEEAVRILRKDASVDAEL
ncbi:type II secretion system protein GspE [Pacificimonas flava]|uniref:Type II secretion system protein E n=2 Tax=Pacificimonas TaxID=1960290 RepID=A0A219B0L3_9SPHN|nr:MULTISPECIES: type II secretion system ATPase GspE [Pacificimonas]MBZ6379792.1 type II secretion system ATPase GspE [Pacificimonas aurantium]OWV31754.1 type II secretion system protein GspE [Pacificimonas flava]